MKNENENDYHEDLKKRGYLENSFVLVGVTPLWHVAQLVSRAPPHHTLPAFINLNGRLLNFRKGPRNLLQKMSFYFGARIFVNDFKLQYNVFKFKRPELKLC